jgi:3-dehydroquinate dehydratase type I
MICVSISDVGQLSPALHKGAVFLELRLDLIRRTPADLYSRIPAGIKTLATCRPGPYSDPERSDLLTDCLKKGASYVDLELESDASFTEPIQEEAERHGCDVVFSHHDYNETPAEDLLEEILEKCYLRGGSVAKIATMVREREDLIRLLSLYRIPGRKVILGMGDPGRVSRVAGPYLGSEFTFAAPENNNETAPGQLSLEALLSIYKALEGS